MKNLYDKNILVTGAAGGIGTRLSMLLATEGANLVLSSRCGEKLNSLKQEINNQIGGDENIHLIAKDLLAKNAGAELVQSASKKLGGMDMVINLAGTQTFRALENVSPAEIHNQITMNLSVPIDISREAISLFKNIGEGSIVNIGSAFGSIGFSQHSTYCATKFGLRGFSEALRRELQQTDIEVIYIAPRATRTGLNSQRIYDMASVTGASIDDPESVARQILKAIKRSRANTLIGLPENIASKVNSLFPVLIYPQLRGPYGVFLISEKHIIKIIQCSQSS
jgi:short-subunit dehydrogenase